MCPAAVPGIVFLSGGQSPRDATDHLNAMNAMGQVSMATQFLLWTRAPGAGAFYLERTGRQCCRGAAGVPQALPLNGLAREGIYSRAMETA